MLEIKNISKYFNTNLVLDNISFTVPKGKIFGIIGPNGAGKTTTLRIILGILTPSEGEVLFNNEKVNQNFMNITGYLPEERGLYPKSNIVNTLVYLAQLKGLTHSDALERTYYWLERLDLREFENFTIEELSKGNQQKIQFISAILHQPKILILDEPFSGFDPVNQSIFREIINDIKSNCFIILSTHLMDLAESLCDEIILINNGKKIISGEVSALINMKSKNIYEIMFDIPDKKNIEDLIDFKVISISNNILTLDIVDYEPAKVIKELSSFINIKEFRKKSVSLNNLFLSLVEEENV